MRFAIFLVLGLVACKGSSKGGGPDVNEADWKPIEALATTPSATGALMPARIA